MEDWKTVISGPLDGDAEFIVLMRGAPTAARLGHMRKQMDMIGGWIEQDEAEKTRPSPNTGMDSISD